MPAPSRRTVVAAVALAPVAVATGCGGTAVPRAGADPDVVLVRAALTGVEGLVAAYAATMRRHRRLGGALSPLLAHHRAHRQLLRAALPDGDGSDPPPAARVRAPRGAAAALAALQEAESVAADGHLTQVRQARSGALARVLASVTASEVQHVALLAGLLDAEGRRS